MLPVTDNTRGGEQTKACTPTQEGQPNVGVQALACPARPGPELLRALEASGYSVDQAEDTRKGGHQTTSSRPGRLTLKLRTRGGTPVIGKLYSAGKGAQVFHTMQRLWRSPFGRQRKPPGLAEPIDYITIAGGPDKAGQASCLSQPALDTRDRQDACPALSNTPGIVIAEWMPGRPLIELQSNPAHLAESMRLLADLHTCGVVPERRRTWRGILRSLDRKIQKVGELAPQYVSHLQPIIAALHATRVKDIELVCAHGDFSARNVLVSDARYILMDWDRLQHADPARDVAYFAIWPWREAIRRGRLPERRRLDAAVEAYAEFRPDCKLDKQLPFHVAAGLIRMCCSLITLWPEQTYLVPGLAKTALRELEKRA